MTNYYVKFDENGNQSETKFGLDDENPSGWFDTGLENIDNLQFKLVNNQAVALSVEELNNKYKGLTFNAGLALARVQRDVLLSACDWTQGIDSPLSVELKEAWATYRQALRDLPSTVDEDGEFTLPIAPDSNFDPLGLN
jgi:hypothetical protein